MRSKMCQQNLGEKGIPRTSEWARRRLAFQTLRLLRPNAQLPLNGFEKMTLFSWVIATLARTDGLPFVLEYQDIRSPNIMLQDDKDITYISHEYTKAQDH